MSRGNTTKDQRLERDASNSIPSERIINKADNHALYCRPPRMYQTSTTIDEMGISGAPVLTCSKCTIDTVEIGIVQQWRANRVLKKNIELRIKGYAN